MPMLIGKSSSVSSVEGMVEESYMGYYNMRLAYHHRLKEQDANRVLHHLFAIQTISQSR